MSLRQEREEAVPERLVLAETRAAQERAAQPEPRVVPLAPRVVRLVLQAARLGPLAARAAPRVAQVEEQGGGGAAGPDATIQAGAADRFLIIGTIVTPATTFDGQVLVEGDTITCAAPGTDCEAEAGAQGATIIETNGIVAPGLIDTHNHILFDIFDDDDWLPNIPSSCNGPSDCEASSYCSNDKCDCVDGICRYTNHNQWPSEIEYGVMMDYKQCLEDASQGKPVWCPQTYDGDGDLKCEMDKWGELKGLIAGTTSIVGLPGTSSQCFSSLSRSIDVSQNDLSEDKIQTSALFPSIVQRRQRCMRELLGRRHQCLSHPLWRRRRPGRTGRVLHARGRLPALTVVCTPQAQRSPTA